jgi:RHH-type proline utilization regulon transcriptional repressor/proline dehydrogenase/delta 1-pyrroline-5-carboxylate dehydrogenase
VFNATRVGNTYINRNMVGAVAGVNPFGGRGNTQLFNLQDN